MSIPLRAHPSWIFYNLPFGFLLLSFTPLDSDYLWIWDAILKTSPWFFLLCISGLGTFFWIAWRLLTNGLAVLPPNSLWSNVWWWLFLFSYPAILFVLPFYDQQRILPELITEIAAIIGFLSMIIVAILSGKLIPMAKNISIDEDGEMHIALSALSKSAEQTSLDNAAKKSKDIPVLYIGKLDTTPQTNKKVSLEQEIRESNTITSLLGAIITGDLDLVRTALADHPEELNIAYAQNGNTPLHVAALNGYTEIVRLLLQQPGIDTTRTNNEGKTSLDLAREKGFTEIVLLLENK